MKAAIAAAILSLACSAPIDPNDVVPEAELPATKHTHCFLAVSKHHIEPQEAQSGIGARGGEENAALKRLHTSASMPCEKACTVDESTVPLTVVQSFNNGQGQQPPETFLCLGEMPAINS